MKLTDARPSDKIRLLNRTTGECLTIEQWAIVAYERDKKPPLVHRTLLRRMVARVAVGQSFRLHGHVYERVAQDTRDGPALTTDERLALLETKFAELYAMMVPNAPKPHAPKSP